MGFLIILEDETARPLDQTELSDQIGKRLPTIANGQYSLLQHVDPYGDTVFNRPQMEAFLPDWRRLVSECGAQQSSEVAAVESMALRCRDEVHLYLRFRGD